MATVVGAAWFVMADENSCLDERVFLTPSSPISLRGTPLARQGYVPDLEPLLKLLT